MSETTLPRSRSRAGLRRGLMIGCSVWETPEEPAEYRFIKPLYMDNGLQRRWLVHVNDGLTYFCLDDNYATLAEARESVGM